MAVMAAGDHYRIRAAELKAAARRERNPQIRKEYESLAMSYLRLSDQAERNSMTDIVYETPLRPPVRSRDEPDSKPQDKS